MRQISLLNHVTLQNYKGTPVFDYYGENKEKIQLQMKLFSHILDRVASIAEKIPTCQGLGEMVGNMIKGYEGIIAGFIEN